MSACSTAAAKSGACVFPTFPAVSAAAPRRRRRLPTRPRPCATSWPISAKASSPRRGPPTTLTEIVASGEIAEGESAVMIPLLLDSGRTVHADVSLDAALLEAIDATAKERGLSRSAFLASAAREKIMAGA